MPRRKELRGGSFFCPTFFKACALAEGKTWEQSRAKLNALYAEIDERGMRYWFYGRYAGTGNFERYFEGEYQGYREDASQKCNSDKSTQWQLGKCIESLHELKLKIDSVPQAKVQQKRHVEESYVRERTEADQKYEEYRKFIKSKVMEKQEQLKPYIDALTLLGNPYHPTFSRRLRPRTSDA